MALQKEVVILPLRTAMYSMRYFLRLHSSSPRVDNTQAGDIAWILTSSALVLLMIPGVGFFYSGNVCCDNVRLLLLISYLDLRIDLTLSSPALAIGATADRGRMLPCLVFMFIWSTIIYDPLVEWTWNPNGWVYKLGGLDFAGGTPVHISSGAAALANSIMLGNRKGYSTTHGLPYRPHNVTHVVLGTVFLWVASCSGAVSGLVAITPASGYVPPCSAVIFGVVGAISCNYATKFKFILGVVDALDMYAEHGVGGIVGNLLTVFFAADYIAALDGYTAIAGGWLNHNYIQLAYQVADCVSGFAYSFFGTCIILVLMNLVPGLSLRATEEEEDAGLDEAQLGEFAYDYVELRRDYSDVIVIEGVEGNKSPEDGVSLHNTVLHKKV